MSDADELRQLDELMELERRFRAHVLKQREKWRLAFYDLMQAHLPNEACCEDADVEFLTKPRLASGGLSSLYCEWACRTHGNGTGMYFPVNAVYKAIRS